MIQEMKRRATVATATNTESRRCHVIMTAVVDQTTTNLYCHKTKRTSVVEEEIGTEKIEKVEVKQSNFDLVDLVGSEIQKRSMSSGKR